MTILGLCLTRSKELLIRIISMLATLMQVFILYVIMLYPRFIFSYFSWQVSYDIVRAVLVANHGVTFVWEMGQLKFFAGCTENRPVISVHPGVSLFLVTNIDLIFSQAPSPKFSVMCTPVHTWLKSIAKTSQSFLKLLCLTNDNLRTCSLPKY